MKPKTLRTTVGVVVAVVAIGAIAYDGFFAAPVRQEPVAGPVIVTGSINEEGPGYSISGSYPEIEKGTNAAAFNAYVTGIVQSEENGFKQNLSEVAVAGGTSTLTVQGAVVATSTDFVSVLFSTESFLVGMAHPSDAMISVNFDLSRGKNIALSDLFIPGADYLNVIADYAANDIADQIKNGTYFSTSEYIAQSGGLAADPANFEVFNITPHALILHFQEYQVGPYASGPATTTIPWDALSSIVSPVSPLLHLF